MIQENIRVTKEVADWMNKHPLSNNALVTYALHLLMQIEANATRQLEVRMKAEHVPTPNQLKEALPF